MSTSPIRFGIIGCAEISSKVAHAISLSPNATLIAVGSRSIDKARQFISNNALPTSTIPLASYDAVLDHPSVDAVYVPLPTSLHVTWAVAAAKKGKHVLLEKPTALCVEELAIWSVCQSILNEDSTTSCLILDGSAEAHIKLDVILQACRENRVQFMDSTMMMHHPRTEKMLELITDPTRFGEVKTVDSIYTYSADENFLQNDIRVKPDLDALGSLGDVGWYCIRSILWANSYQLPKTAVALRGPVKNNAGVLLSCGAQLLWPDGRIASLHCSFLAHLCMQLTVIGTKGLLHVTDFAIPYEEGKTSFAFVTDATELATSWDPVPSKHEVITDLPQEARMVQEFARLVKLIKEEGKEPETKWPEISRKTQLVTDAIKKSVDNGFEPVEIIG